jgi:hypothetical protein
LERDFSGIKNCYVGKEFKQVWKKSSGFLEIRSCVTWEEFFEARNEIL